MLRSTFSNHDDRVSTDDADREHQAEQRERLMKSRADRHGEGADDRYRHGDQWNDRRRARLQEQDYHQHTSAIASNSF